MPNNQVRIIGGQWKGRKLKFAARPGLRPTLARVRERLFAWLAPHLAGAACLDLFAGSGVLGFEALSRGASSLVSVDQDAAAAVALRRNGQLLLGQQVSSQMRVLQADAIGRLRGARGRGIRVGAQQISRWRCVFLDPPYATNLLPRALDVLRTDGLLTPDGFAWFETRRRQPLALDGWRLVREGFAGDNRFGLLRLADS